MIRNSCLAFFRRLVRCERGSPIIGFILTLPVVLVLFFGIMEVARLLWYQHVITKGVRDGTRYLSRVPVPLAGGACGTFPAAAVTTAEGLLLDDAPWPNNANATVTAALVPVPNNGAFAGTNPLCLVEMQAVVQMPFPILGALLGAAGENELAFTVADRARHIGQ